MRDLGELVLEDPENTGDMQLSSEKRGEVWCKWPGVAERSESHRRERERLCIHCNVN